MKYIIELDEIPNTGLFKARGSNTLVFDRKGIENILKQNNPNIQIPRVAEPSPADLQKAQTYIDNGLIFI